MNHRILAVVTALAAVVCVFLLAAGPAAGQAFWAKDTPKLPMAKTWLAAKAKLPPYTPPRTPDGVPDLQGRWGGAGGDGLSDLEDHEYVDVTTPAQESFRVRSTRREGPLHPVGAGEAERDSGRVGARMAGRDGRAPLQQSRVVLSPGTMPQLLVWRPGDHSAAWLRDDAQRVRPTASFPTDGRPPISQNVKIWFGTSRGRWEGDTLVVEVTSLNGMGWLDSTGHFFSENTRMTERWKMVDANTIDYEVTVEDPTIYTRPWKMNFPKRRPGTGPRSTGPLPNAATVNTPAPKDPYAVETWEVACYEGNTQVPAGIRELGYKCFRGVTPPK